MTSKMIHHPADSEISDAGRGATSSHVRVCAREPDLFEVRSAIIGLLPDRWMKGSSVFVQGKCLKSTLYLTRDSCIKPRILAEVGWQEGKYALKDWIDRDAQRANSIENANALHFDFLRKPKKDQLLAIFVHVSVDVLAARHVSKCGAWLVPFALLGIWEVRVEESRLVVLLSSMFPVHKDVVEVLHCCLLE